MTDTTTINTTSLARRYGVTTKALEKRLEKLGISPYQELVQPSGKRFVLWPSEASIKALDRYKTQRLDDRSARKNNPATVAREDSLLTEIREIKDMLKGLIDQLQRVS